jgi:hypothetical protein
MGEHQSDTQLQCAACGFTQEVRFAYHLQHGWPSCPRDSRHGELFITEVEPGAIVRAVDDRLRPVLGAIEKASHLMDRGR